MQDRTPQYPGRVTLTPVEGQANTYDMVRADQPTQAGTPLNKANLLKDTTAALFGLGTGAVPDDVLGWLGKYNEHWWSLFHDKSSEGYSETLTAITSQVNFFDEDSGAYSRHVTISYSKTIQIDQATGAVSLVSPASYEMHTLGAEPGHEDGFVNSLLAMAPVYITGLNGNTDSSIYLLPAGGTLKDYDFSRTICRWGSYISSYYGWSSTYFLVPYAQNGVNGNSDAAMVAKKVSSSYWHISAGDTTYAHSTDRNAFPDSGTVDGILYAYLGRPFEKFPTMPQVETGTYVGTGEYGVSNKNTLTFNSVPKLILIQGTGSNASCGWILPGAGYGSSFHAVNNCTISKLIAEVNDKTISWYPFKNISNGGWYQLNEKEVAYHYIALG